VAPQRNEKFAVAPQRNEKFAVPQRNEKFAVPQRNEKFAVFEDFAAAETMRWLRREMKSLRFLKTLRWPKLCGGSAEK